MQTKTFSEYRQIVDRHKILVFLTGISAGVTALIASMMVGPFFESRVQFYVVENSESGSFFSSSGLGSRARALLLPTFSDSAASAYVGMLQSDAIRKRVVAKVPEKPLNALKTDVDVAINKKYLISVRVLDQSPELAAKVAAAYPQALNTFLLDVATRSRQQSLAGMQESRRQLAAQVIAARSELATFLRNQQTSSLQKDGDRLLDRKTAVEAQAAGAQAKLQGIEQRISIAQRQLNSELASGEKLAGLFNPTVQRMTKELSDLETDLAAAKAEFDGPQAGEHPKLRALQARVEQKKRLLEQELRFLRSTPTSTPDTLQEQLRRELASQYKEQAATKAELLAYHADLAQLQKQIELQQPPRLTEGQLTAEVTRLEKMLDGLALQIREIQTQNITATNSVVVLNEASVPSDPKFPSPVLNTVLGTLLGLLGGVYLVFLLDFLQQRRFSLNDAPILPAPRRP